MLTDKQYLDRIQSCILLRQQGYYSAASQVSMDLLRHRPDESSLWHQLGQIATANGDADAALAAFGRALHLLRAHGAVATHAAQFQATSLGYAQSLMRLGRFEEAWPLFEAGRLHVSWSPWPATEYWDGIAEPVPSLLVQAEGGYGDIFMFMRWISLLKSVKGAGRIGLMIFPQLADFCDWKALGVDQVYKTGVDKIPFGQWMYSTSIMSLPACFNVKTREEITVPDDTGMPGLWNRGDTDINEPLRLGFCWRAEENSSPIRTKSLELETATEITDLIRITCAKLPEGCMIIDVLSLSPEKKDLYNTDPFGQPPNLTYEPDRMQTWRDTAAYLCSMDYVLTVDSAVGHLCGLLDVPCMVLVPRGGCWRFGTHDRVSGPWYGPSLTYYRQPEVLVWDPEDIVKALMEKIYAGIYATNVAAANG